MNRDDMFRPGPKLGRMPSAGASVLQLPEEDLGLGERLPRAMDYDLTRPEYAEVMERILFARKGKRRPPVKRTRVRRDVRPEELAKGLIRTMEVIPSECVISNYQVGTRAVPIDTRLKSRTDIIIANMSTNIVWVNTNASNLKTGAASYVGIPLSPATGATGFDGGVWRARITENKRWWAVATAASSLVVVVELSRR
jgi:hypothetical protein